ncbi:MAG: helix-turn-helix transcriptional regulator [Oscillospiraceae bacterium]|nr:helix-turn-helix transcriptional regulator [Oscillospiraceae bacterium]
MVRHLNQLNFKDFGTVPPERTANASFSAANVQTITISSEQGDAAVYQALSDTFVHCGKGMTVLSVSLDQKQFQHYYLDKGVCIRAGVYFSLSPFRQNAFAVSLSAQSLPKRTEESQPAQDFRYPPQVRVTELYTFFYHEKERGFVFSGESHPMMELTYVDQGTLHSVVDGQETVLEQGELMLYGPNQWHMQYADVDVAPRYVTISFDLQTTQLPLLINRKFKIPQRAAFLLQQLLHEQDRMDKYSSDLIISLLTQFLIFLLRSTDDADTRLKASNSVHSENEIIRRAQQYVSAHIREKLSVPTVARMVDVSPSYLTALFHKNLQISPGEYIRRIKLQESKQMIRENSMNFSEIAAALQYSTVHHFSRQFKDKFGITPTEYAKSVRSF